MAFEILRYRGDVPIRVACDVNMCWIATEFAVINNLLFITTPAE